MGDTYWWFYNLGPGRSTTQVNREIRAMLGTNPLVLGLCEATGYDLAAVKDYTLLRDRSRPGRANIAAYVATRRTLSHLRWHDLAQVWNRTEHPGVHWPRSWLEFDIGRVQVLIGHQPPQRTSNTLRAQQEGIALLTTRLAPWTRDTWKALDPRAKAKAKDKPRVLLWDANRRPGEKGPGPSTLAADVPTRIVGNHIDLANVRGHVDPLHHRYPDTVAGVVLRSDHDTAFNMKAGIPDRWLAKP